MMRRILLINTFNTEAWLKTEAENQKDEWWCTHKKTEGGKPSNVRESQVCATWCEKERKTSAYASVFNGCFSCFAPHFFTPQLKVNNWAELSMHDHYLPLNYETASSFMCLFKENEMHTWSSVEEKKKKIVSEREKGLRLNRLASLIRGSWYQVNSGGQRNWKNL